MSHIKYKEKKLKSSNALNVYQSVSNESDKLETDPYKIICILMKNVLLATERAKLAMQGNQIEEKGIQISLAISLIDGLQASLDKEKGGEISENLAKLYDYMMRLLVESNLKNKTENLDEVGVLMKDIYSAWIEIDPHKELNKNEE